MLLIDSNALILLLVGWIDPELIGQHKRVSIYQEQDFLDLEKFILDHIKDDYQQLIVLPNVWTEVDNILNKLSKTHYRMIYLDKIRHIIKISSENFLASINVLYQSCFETDGLTDALLLEYAKTQNMILITADSALADYARAENVVLYDLNFNVQQKNKKFKSKKS